MKILKFVVLGCVWLATLQACRTSMEQSQSGATLVNFAEYEKDVQPYRTRVIVTDNFMRFDDGKGDPDFILFDRKKNIIYSVDSTEETIMLVTPASAQVKPPFKLVLTQKELDSMAQAPTIENKKPQHHQFLANGELCYEVISVPDLLPQVVQAMQAFNRVLASESAMTFNNIPADVQNACDMSRSTFAVGRHLQYGFPLREWDPKGKGRDLVDYQRNYKPEPKLFELPANYQKFNIQEYREGKVKFEE